MKKFMISLSISLALLLCGISAFAFSGNFGKPILTLEAEEAVFAGTAASHGWKVGNIGLNGGNNEGTVTFENLDIPEDGTYILRVHYCSGSDDRYFQFTTEDGNKTKLDCPSTGGFTTVGSILMRIELKKGGSLTVGSDWYGPDLDKIEIFPEDAFDETIKNYANPDPVAIKKGELTLTVDKNNGVYSLSGGEKAVIINASSEVLIKGETLSSDRFKTHTVTEDGKTVTVVHSAHPTFKGTLVDVFTFEDGYMTIQTTLDNAGEMIAVGGISPLTGYRNSLGIENGIFLKMPFDNDKWLEPQFLPISELGMLTTGYEIAAVYDRTNSAGIVLGSLTHDTWKTGINITTKEGALTGFSLYGGAADSGTSDVVPHGEVIGERISSPLMFFGVFNDFKDGLNQYADASAAVVPPKNSVSDVPFGYNSWGSLQGNVSYSAMIATSNYIKEHLQDAWQQKDEPVYVNIDSFWDYIVRNDPSCNIPLDEALIAFVETCHENGQNAGIYYTPFAAWHSSEEELKNATMEGSDYTYYDALLRRPDGSIYGTLAGGYALDPTHPGTIARIETVFQEFIDMGFSYIKLDFLTHGSLEGVHYDPDITTGIQAYNYGMSLINKICDGKMYVNLSIAPLFPYQYADGRRISCDAFATIDRTKHVLSHLTAGFWQKGLYSFPDPDHLVVLGVSESHARCRVTSGIISGTSFIVGDDLSNIKPGSSEEKRILKMYTNKDIIAVAKLGEMFTPHTIVPNKQCAEIYYTYVDGTLYIAAFNFEGVASRNFDLSTFIDEEIPSSLTAKELWSGKTISVKDGKLSVNIPSEDVGIYAITLNEDVPPTVSPEPTETVELNGHMAYIDKNGVTLYFCFNDDAIGKIMEIDGQNYTVSDSNHNGVAISLKAEDLEKKITVKYNGEKIEEYTLKEYLTAVVALPDSTADQKAVANALLEKKDYVAVLPKKES